MTILVIGTVNRDTIIRPGHEQRESFGGLLYTLLTLALLMGEDIRIIPVFNVGQDVAEQVLALLEPYSQIATAGIKVVPEMNNHAILTYRSESQREEVLEGGVPPLQFRQVAPFLSADILLVNFISGRELSLETMRQIRSRCQSTIYADLHSLTLGMDRRGRRYWRQFRQWPDWVSQMDVVQMNRAEARLLSRSPMRSDADFVNLGKRVLDQGPSILLVTLGADGSAMAISQDGQICLDRFAAHAPLRVRDTTGCGDVFLAAFVAQHARSGDAQAASRFANLMAGSKSGWVGIEEVKALAQLGSGNARQASVRKVKKSS